MSRDRHRAPHRGHARGGASQRQLRVGEVLRHALSEVLERGDLRDPDLAGVSLTVTEVSMSPDLRNATAFIVPLGGSSADTVLPALRRAAPYLQRQVVGAVELRFVPTLRFEADTSFDYASRIDTLLHSPDVARDLGADDGDGEIGDGGSGDGS